MQRQKRGKILNIASGLGLRARKDTYMYSVAKAGVISLTRTLALSYAADNIQVNALAAGLVFQTEAQAERYHHGRYIPGRARGTELGDGADGVVPVLRRRRRHHRRGLPPGRRRPGRGIAPTGWAPRIPLPGGSG